VRLLAVAPEARGRGVGVTLMRECIRRARQTGALALTLHTTEIMAAAMRLYERMGFARAPELDIQPAPGVTIKRFRLGLEAPASVWLARIGGGGLLALGIACWCARETPLTPAGLGVARGFLAYNLVACVTLALARPAVASGGLPALAAAFLHGVLASALLRALFGPRRSSAGP